ncbi:MAG TPA: hypothetical protein VNR18_08670 [Hyphomicrobiales bacterium]|nr:hypothetical protein [Hyphomicrobiales bacterium]
MPHSLFSLASILLTVFAYVPYIRAIRRKQVKPHFYSWLVWSLTTSIVFLAQLSADGGVGAWPTGVSALITIFVATLAWLLKGDVRITRLDRAFLIAALASIPVWGLTADPLWSVIILTGIDAVGFGPTLRKLWHLPHEESAWFYALFALRSFLSILALESLNLTTVLFPAVMVIACILVCGLLWWRRRAAAGTA